MSAKPKIARLRCSACGVEAACDCGAEYISAGEYARRMKAANPGVSNRAIAAKAGVSEATVRRAPASNDAPEKVVGLDGKSYAPKRPVKSEEPVGVSFLITQAQKTQLRERGYTDEQIYVMKPEEAHRILGLQPTRDKPGTPEQHAEFDRMVAAGMDRSTAFDKSGLSKAFATAINAKFAEADAHDAKMVETIELWLCDPFRSQEHKLAIAKMAVMVLSQDGHAEFEDWFSDYTPPDDEEEAEDAP